MGGWLLLIILLILTVWWIHTIKSESWQGIEEPKKDEWMPGLDLRYDIQIMCDQTERFTIAQIIEACEVSITHPELTVDVLEEGESKYVGKPMVVDQYGFPAVGVDTGSYESTTHDNECICGNCIVTGMGRPYGLFEEDNRDWYNERG